MIIKSGKELVKRYYAIRKKALKNNYDLNNLTDDELLIFIATKTYDYGRSLKDSLENAKFHMKDRKSAIERFNHKTTDLMGMSV